YRTPLGIRLQQPPFSRHQRQLSHPASYTACQQLGTAMREAGVAAFEYVSARSATGGLCAALYTPQALSTKKPAQLTSWLCELTAEQVLFKQAGTTELVHFSIEQFMVDGTFPSPA